MAKPRSHFVTDLRGAARLTVDATTGVTDLVENLHRTIQRTPLPLGRSISERTRGVTGLVYQSVRGGTRLVGHGLDLLLAGLTPLIPESADSSRRAAMVSVLNGLYGDHLHDSANPLALPMSLRQSGHLIDPEDPAEDLGTPARRKILLMVHGLCLNEEHWQRDGHDHGARLAQRHDYSVLYLRYNSGRAIADNGQQLAMLIDRLLQHWPTEVEELSLVGHSMGGLVIRSACHSGVVNGRAWVEKTRRLVFLGTPHAGAPLEKGGHWLDRLLEASPYSAPFARLGKARSVGISDLRHGWVTGDAAVKPRLPAQAVCHAVAAQLRQGEGVDSRLIGDGLVPLNSALGHHELDGFGLNLPASHCHVVHDTGHMELLSHVGAYQQMNEWFGQTSS